MTAVPPTVPAAGSRAHLQVGWRHLARGCPGRQVAVTKFLLPYLFSASLIPQLGSSWLRRECQFPQVQDRQWLNFQEEVSEEVQGETILTMVCKAFQNLLVLL